MAFLDNSGDIILDAVLTDTGRMRLARGDGSFKIAKFAFGDDEINYALYDKNDVSGSAYYDLEILQSPVLEAFTNNTSFLKSKLMTIPRTNLLYLPVIMINTLGTPPDNLNFSDKAGGSIFVVTADTATQAAAETLTCMNGVPGPNLTVPPIGLEQGLQTTEIPPAFTLDPDLVENQYIVEMDNRLCQLADPEKNIAPVSFIDDDNVASYFISRGAGGSAFIANGTGQNDADGNFSGDTPITGPRGTKFRFTLRTSIQLQTSTYLFTKLGTTVAAAGDAVATALNGSYYFIDTNIRITGGQTGYRIDVPVRLIKLV